MCSMKDKDILVDVISGLGSFLALVKFTFGSETVNNHTELTEPNNTGFTPRAETHFEEK